MRTRIHSKFTLVELLIVIAVIAMLAGMLLPALTQAKFKVQQSVCDSNLKQLGLAMLQYDIDSTGRLPGMWDATSGNEQLNGWIYYKDFSNCSAEGNFDPSKGCIFDYAKSKKIFHCPRVPINQGDDYAINKLLGDGQAATGFHLGMNTAKITVPSKTFMLIEESVSGNTNHSTDDGYLNPPGNISTERHNGTGSFLFCDGHVQNLFQIMAQYPNPNGTYRYEPN